MTLADPEKLRELALNASYGSISDARLLDAAASLIESQAAEIAELRSRLLERANEEPPTGWLRPGEEGYENTPQGARDARDAALAKLAAAEAERDAAHANRYHQALGAKWMAEAIVRECRTTFRLNRNAQTFADHFERKWEDKDYWRPARTPGPDDPMEHNDD